MSEQKPHKVKDIFVEGPIDPAFIATSIAKHSTRTDIGAHEIFLGQVRADAVQANDRSSMAVQAIEYTAYRDMALERMTAIREEEVTKLLRIEDELHKRVISQEKAISALARAIGKPDKVFRPQTDSAEGHRDQ